MKQIIGIVGNYIISTLKPKYSAYESAINYSEDGYWTGWKIVRRYNTKRDAENGHYELTLLSEKELSNLPDLES